MGQMGTFLCEAVEIMEDIWPGEETNYSKAEAG